MIFGILAKPNLKAFRKVKAALIKFLTKRKSSILVDESLEKFPNSKISYASKINVIKKSDVLIVLGGDGTLLHIAEAAAKNKKPVIGINLGNLGFLTEAPISKLKNLLEEFYDDNLVVDTRELLQAKIVKNGKQILKTSFLNDVVINKGALAKICLLYTSPSPRD